MRLSGVRVLPLLVMATVALAGCATSSRTGISPGSSIAAPSPSAVSSSVPPSFSPSEQPHVAFSTSAQPVPPCGQGIFADLGQVRRSHLLTAAFQVSISAAPSSSPLPDSQQSFVTLPVDSAILIAGHASNGPMKEIVWVVDDSSPLPKSFWLEPRTYVLLVDVPPGSSKQKGYGWYGYAPGENASFIVKDRTVIEECSAQSASDPAKFTSPPQGGSESLAKLRNDLRSAFAEASAPSKSS